MKQVSPADLNAFKEEMQKEFTAAVLKLQKTIENDHANSVDKLKKLVNVNTQATKNLTYLLMGLYVIIVVAVCIAATVYIRKQLKNKKPKTLLLETNNHF